MSGNITGITARIVLSMLLWCTWSSAQVSWTHFDYENTSSMIGSPDVYTIAIDPNDGGRTVWFGSRPNDTHGWGAGLASYDTLWNQWTLYTMDNSSLPHNWVYDIEFDSEGNLWIGTKGGGLAKFEPPYEEYGWTVYNEASGLGYDNCYEVFIDADDNIWIGHGPPDAAGIAAGLTVFDGLMNWQTFGTPTLAENAVYAITVDDTGAVWCATKTQGLYILDHGGTPFNTDNDQWTHITGGINPAYFNSNAAMNLNGELWFGHDNGGGLDQWDGTTWTNHLTGQWIRTVTSDWRDYIWCGEKRGYDDATGFWIYDGSEWTNYSEDDGLGWNVVCAITLNNETGDVWIGHGNPSEDGGGVTWVRGLLPPEEEAPVSVESQSAVPVEFDLGQNYPNPFNPLTSIVYSIDESQSVELAIFDLKGRLIRTLVAGFQPAGWHVQVWDGRDGNGDLEPSGVYIYRLRTEAGDQLVRKAVFMK